MIQSLDSHVSLQDYTWSPLNIINPKLLSCLHLPLAQKIQPLPSYLFPRVSKASVRLTFGWVGLLGLRCSSLLLWLPFVSVHSGSSSGTLTSVCCGNVKAQAKNIVLWSPQSFQISAKLVRVAISPILGPSAASLGLIISQSQLFALVLISFPIRDPTNIRCQAETGDLYIIVNSKDITYLLFPCCFCCRDQES